MYSASVLIVKVDVEKGFLRSASNDLVKLLIFAASMPKTDLAQFPTWGLIDIAYLSYTPLYGKIDARKINARCLVAYDKQFP